jgi:hypothetical protein
MIKPSSSPTDVPTTNGIITLLRHLHQLIQRVSHASIGGFLSKCFAMADTGATDHMLPKNAAFTSYKLVSNLQVHMGNNSFLPVLGCGIAVISLNGQRVLIRNALHVPGLANVSLQPASAPQLTWLCILWPICCRDACLLPNLCAHSGYIF